MTTPVFLLIMVLCIGSLAVAVAQLLRHEPEDKDLEVRP